MTLGSQGCSPLPPLSRRALLIAVCLAILLAQSGITLYLPAIPAITAELNANNTFAGLSLTAFLLGMALPMLLWGKWCVIHGALRVLIGTLALYGASSSFITMAEDSEAFLALRLLQGIAAGGVSVSGRSLIREHFEGYQLTQALSLLSLCFVMTLGVAQFVGALLEATWGWQGGFASCGLLSLLLAAGLAPFSTKRSAHIHCTPSHATYWRLLSNPSFLRPILAGGFGYAIIVVFSGAAPSVFQQQFGWTSLEYGWLGWPISLAYLLGAVLAHRLSALAAPHILLRRGGGLLLIGAGSMATGALMTTSQPMAVWLPYCLMLVAQGLIFPLCQTMASQQSQYGAQAMALIGLLHQLIAAFAGVLVSVMTVEDSEILATVCLVLATSAWLVARR